MADTEVKNPTQGAPYSEGIDLSELAEYVEDTYPGGGPASWMDASETIVYQVPWSKMYDAIITCLGWSWIEKRTLSTGQGAPAAVADEGRWFCRRILPLSHPWKPNLICTNISNWQGIGPRGKQDALFAARMDGAGLPCPPSYSKYEYFRFTANFTQVKYELYSDEKMGFGVSPVGGQAGNEYLRFTWQEAKPSANMITLDQGTMQYAEGPSFGTTFTSPGYAQAEVQQAIQLRWTNVPLKYVCGVSGRPERLLYSLQKVNSTLFMGCKPGTLLMEPYEFEYYRMPLPDKNGNFLFWCDITLNMTYFDPPYGDLEPGETRTKYGHLTAPRSPNQYYWIVNTIDGSDRYESYDFNLLFYPLTQEQALT